MRLHRIDLQGRQKLKKLPCYPRSQLMSSVWSSEANCCVFKTLLHESDVFEWNHDWGSKYEFLPHLKIYHKNLVFY